MESWFHLSERGTNVGTEIRAGVTTFLVMVYIIAVNPAIIAGPLGLDPVAVAAGTALVAGLMTLLMGLTTNYPFALAAGLGLNAVVAFSLPALGMTPAEAMGVIVIEGLVITLLVVVGLREAMMNAVPLGLKRAIGVGIGLFILFIGFWDGGMIVGVTPEFAPPPPPLAFVFPNSTPQWVFLIGLLITVVLWGLKIRGALILSIILTTIVAFVTGVAKMPAEFTITPNFSTLGLGLQDLGGIFTIPTGVLGALLAIFTIMLSDFFDTMGTVTGVAAEAGLAEEDGTVPGVGRVLLVDGLAAAVGGAAGVSSNTTYIESAAGVADGGRTGLTSVVVGILFLAAILLSPLAAIIPTQATAPALVLVGFLMFTQIGEIDARDFLIGFPALLIIILMPLTFTITIGIGAGMVMWVILQIVAGRAGQVHWLMWLVFLAFLLFFAQTWVTTMLAA
ncbi:MAG TPA: NCS2 family permease [Candidatus Limnocylindria bacterium]|nr:NCS2 family permease [Candidatus Limnocylindria bacterium]